MTRRTIDTVLDSVAAATGLLRRGESFVIRTTGESVAEVAEASIARSLAAGSGCALVSFLEPWDVPGDDELVRVIRLQKARTASDAIRILTREARKLPLRMPFVIPVRPPFPAWLTDASLLKVFEALAVTCRRSGRRAIWITLPGLPGSDHLPAFKDEADFYLELFLVGNQLFTQFLKAREVFEPGFFLPRRVTATGGELRLGAPTIPAHPAQAEPGASIDLFESAYRTIFDTLPEAVVLF